jgi:hypothetical protein
MTVTGRFLLFSHLLYVRKKSNSAAKLRFFLRNAKKIRNFSAFSLPFAKKHLSLWQKLLRSHSFTQESR